MSLSFSFSGSLTTLIVSSCFLELLVLFSLALPCLFSHFSGVTWLQPLDKAMKPSLLLPKPSCSSSSELVEVPLSLLGSCMHAGWLPANDKPSSVESNTWKVYLRRKSDGSIKSISHKLQQNFPPTVFLSKAPSEKRFPWWFRHLLCF